MKNKILFALMSLAVLSSCQKIEDKSFMETLAEKYVELKYNAQQWLQNSLVVVDDEGEMVRRVNGDWLDQADTTVISIPAKDTEMAKSMFLSFVPPGGEGLVFEVDEDATDGEIDGYDYYLMDSESELLGTAEFRYGDNDHQPDPTVLATMTLSSESMVHLVTEVEFIDYKQWPDNADVQKYETGKYYSLEGPKLKLEGQQIEVEYEELTFVCVQGNDSENEAILVHLGSVSATPAAYINADAHFHLATIPEALKVLELYQTDRADFKELLDDSNPKDKLLLNYYDQESGSIMSLDLQDDGEIYEVSVDDTNEYRYILIYTESCIPEEDSSVLQ